MRPARIAVLVLAAFLASAAACRNPGAGGDAAVLQGGASGRPGPAPIVTGTVVDARTGKPVAGAVVRGPLGVEATCDARGRFVLRGLPAGTSGELVATTAAGRTGTNRLRSLAGGPLEVVVHVR
jgi:protocatechuate 3,4-dioxygenase beta subunit